jgi:hypothetical protein
MKLKFRVLDNRRKGVYYTQFRSWFKWRYFKPRCESIIFHDTEEAATKYALAIHPKYVNVWYAILWQVFTIYPKIYQYPTIKSYN